MNGITYRLQNFIRKERCSLLLDASAGLSLGTLPGLEDFSQSVRAILPLVDGIVCSPGQISKLNPLQKTDASLLVRMDWNNTLRGPGFVLPAASAQLIPILSAQDALDLGAAGMVSTFLLGYEEAIEAACLKSTVQLALEGKAIGIPLVVEIQTSGPRVSHPGKAVELGASYALEGGADVIVVPFPGLKSLATIGQFVSVSWLLKPSSLAQAQVELQAALDTGAAGLWLDHSVFANGNASVEMEPFQHIRRTSRLQE